MSIELDDMLDFVDGPPYGLGRIESRDPKDQRFQMAQVLPHEPLPTARYHRTAGVLNQNVAECPQGHKMCRERGFCVGMAWRQWLSSAPMMTRTGPSALQIYHAAQFVDEWDGEADSYAGTSVRAGAKVLQGLGHIDTYYWANRAEDVAEWILSTSTVVMGTSWLDGMFATDRHGIVRLRGRNAGGHAYLCVGYNSSTGMFRCINSWGENWGQKGRFWILGEDFERLLAWGGEACAAKEKLSPA